MIDQRHQLPCQDRIAQPLFVDQIVIAQRQNVGLIGALRRGGQAEQKTGREVVEYAAIGGGGGVMKLIHHYVVEMVRAELTQVAVATQSLYRGKEPVGLILAAAVIEAGMGIRSHADKGALRLQYDFIAMGDEQQATGVHLSGIEGGKPGFAQPRRHHDQAAHEALLAALG